MRILYVCKESHTFSLKKMQHELSIEIDEVNDFETANKCLQKTTYKLIFIVLYPNVDSGFELVRTIRTLKNNNKYATIFAIDKNSSSEEIKSCFQCGMNNFILEPLTNEKLHAAITLAQFRGRSHQISNSFTENLAGYSKLFKESF